MSETVTPLPPPSIALDLNDAEMLASYAVRNNITGLQDAIAEIAAARAFFRAGGLIGDEQKKFYVAYSALAAAISPVTVATLKSSLDEYGIDVRRWFCGPKVKFSWARLASRSYRTWAMIALFSLLIVQSYWLVGSSLLNAFPKPTTEEVESIARFRIAQRKELETFRRANPTIARPPASEAAVSDQESKAAEQQELERAKADYLVRRLEEQREEISYMLVGWCEVIVPKHWLSVDEDHSLPTDRIVALSGRIIDVLQQYILPLLYGWLGAITFVLRTLAQQAKDRLFNVENRIGYGLRIWLGIVAGLAIGWFFKPEKSDTNMISSLSPFALAFLAGYSVDVLFAAMDRLVGAFSSSPEKKTDEKPTPAVK
jgi:hypothetical protein